MTELEQLAGAVLAGGSAFGFEHVFRTNPELREDPSFPFGSVTERAPANDDLLVGAGSVLALVAGEAANNETLRDIGFGATSYSAGMLLKNTLLRNITIQQ